MAFPFGCNCLGLYYNEEMLNEAGVEVPETWDDLKSAAAALSQGDVTGLQPAVYRMKREPLVYALYVYRRIL